MACFQFFGYSWWKRCI